MQKPARDIHDIHVLSYAFVCNHTTSIYHYSFLKITIEVSQVSNDQKQALANAINYVLLFYVSK